MKNESGLDPIGYRVLVKPVEVEQKTKGGILLPDQKKDQDQFKQSYGVLVAKGDLAFSRGTPGTDSYVRFHDAPLVGQAVRYREYAGLSILGDDGERWTLMDDDDIIGKETA